MDLQNIIYFDSMSYHESAKNLFAFHRGHNYRPMVLAFIHGLPFLFGASDELIYNYSYYLNMFCFLGFQIIFFELLKDYLTLKKAFYVTIFTLIFIGNLCFIYHLLSETIYMFVIILGFYFLSKHLQSKQYFQLSISLAIFIISMLIRPGSKFFAIIITLFFITKIIKNYKAKANIWIYGSLFLVLVQCTGIKYQFGNFTISYIDVVTYHNYLGSKAMCLKEGKKYSQENNPRGEYIFSYPCNIQTQIATKDLKNQIQNNTYNLCFAYILDIIENTKTGNTCIYDCKNINKSYYFENIKIFFHAITKWQNRFFSITGFFLSIYYMIKYYKKRNFYFYISLFISYIILSSGVSCSQGDRFHVITFPFVLILIFQFINQKKYLKSS